MKIKIEYDTDYPCIFCEGTGRRKQETTKCYTCSGIGYYSGTDLELAKLSKNREAE